MGPRIQRDRILGSVETVIVHALNDPGTLAELGGMKRVIELTHRYEDGVYARQGHARQERRLKIDPDEIRRLATGAAWVIRRGRAAKVAIERAPRSEERSLPEPAPLDRPVERDRGRRAEGALLPRGGGVSDGALSIETPRRSRECGWQLASRGRRTAALARARALGVRAAAPDRRTGGDPLRSAGALPRLPTSARRRAWSST